MSAEGARCWRQNSPNLDILRAIAVLTVVVDHLVPTLRFHGYEVPHLVQLLTLHIGNAGVLAFFVHNSLVLMYSLERAGGAGRGAWFWRFYLRRGLRIYPLALKAALFGAFSWVVGMTIAVITEGPLL